MGGWCTLRSAKSLEFIFFVLHGLYLLSTAAAGGGSWKRRARRHVHDTFITPQTRTASDRFVTTQKSVRRKKEFMTFPTERISPLLVIRNYAFATDLRPSAFKAPTTFTLKIYQSKFPSAKSQFH